MTVEELRDRKMELEAQKKRELENLAHGGDVGLNVERIDRELQDIKTQFQDMASTLLADDARNTTLAINYFIGKQRFLKLPPAGQPLDDISAQTYEQLRMEISRALEQLTSRQREALYLKLRGWTDREAAAVYGLYGTAISSRVRGAKRSVLEKIEKAMTGRRLLAGGHVLDMREPDVMKAVLAVMTPRQAAYFYLYYSEALSYMEIAMLCGHRNRPVNTAISRALRNIDILLGGQDVVLDHPEALDELGYKVYCELRAHPELARISRSSPRKYSRRGRQDPSPLYHAPYRWAIQVHVWRRESSAWRARGKTPEVPPGRLRAALMEDGKDILQELETVFSVCRYNNQATSQ